MYEIEKYVYKSIEWLPLRGKENMTRGTMYGAPTLSVMLYFLSWVILLQVLIFFSSMLYVFTIL